MCSKAVRFLKLSIDVDNNNADIIVNITFKPEHIAVISLLYTYVYEAPPTRIYFSSVVSLLTFYRLVLLIELQLDVNIGHVTCILDVVLRFFFYFSDINYCSEAAGEVFSDDSYMQLVCVS